MGADRLIYFRTDGNSRIATGHLARCLSIAKACQSLGMRICFLLSGKESADTLLRILPNTGSGLSENEVRVLRTAAFDDLDRELSEISALLGASPKDTVYFVDSYYVTGTYLEALRPLAKTAVLDDLQLFDYPADLVINYDVIPRSALFSYRAAYQKAQNTLLGASYAPLREEFQSGRMPQREAVSDVLVTTGGSDPFHFCALFLQALSGKAPGPVFHIVVGGLNTDGQRLHALAKDLPSVKLHENVTQMAPLMKACDLAVSAAGTTLYELCALGIPTVSFTMADNQLCAARAFADAGAIFCAGDIRSNPEKVIAGTLDFVKRMSDFDPDGASRKAARQAMIRLVDGGGSLRIARALKAL